MDHHDYIRRLQLNKREYEEVLGRMHGASGNSGGAGEGRSRDRHLYAIAEIPVVIEHPEGGTSRFLVYGRNISRGGISVLHGGFLHTGSACRLSLEREGGQLMTVEGEVRHCRLVAGSCHEIGIRFREEIDPGQLRVPPEETAEAEAGGFLAITGRILIGDSFPPDADLLEHHLSMFGVKVIRTETPAEMLAAIEGETIDLVLYGFNVATEEGLGGLAGLRDAGFGGPVILMTAENNSEVLERARQKGATAIITKPYHVDLVVAQLQSHLADAKMPDLLHSTAADQAGMAPLIVHYVKIVRRAADRIEHSCAEGEWAELREHCCQIKGSGCSYGFQHLTVAAITALEALDAGLVAKGDTSAIAALAKGCRSLECNLPAARAA